MHHREMKEQNAVVSLSQGTVTFFFTDIEGSTAMLGRLGSEIYARDLAQHRRVVREALSAHGGTEIDTQGDSFFAVFASPRSCAVAAISIQLALAEYPWPAAEPVRVRMGMHCGEALETATGPVGFDVHRAARVAAVAHGGQIVLSETASALLRDTLPEGAFLQDLGRHRLKSLDRPERLFQLGAPGLETHFPPLRSLGNPELEHNLPVQLTSFVGRLKELADLHSLLDEGRLVTLAGPGGSGKTRLALQVAADLLDGPRDGVWLVDLAPLDAEDKVASEVASVLEVREEASRPLLDTLVDALQYRDLLVVLDNCEHVINASAKLAEAVVRQCPKVSVLATSREPLSVAGERVYRLPPLRLPDAEVDADPDSLLASEAVQLFVERARGQRAEFSLGARNAPAVVSICRHLDGIPLALELAAARIGSMSVQDVEQRLDSRFRLLGSHSRTAAARQQTLEATVAWSYDLLDDAERLVFASLAVFPSSFDLSAAESVCSRAADFDAFEVDDLVQSLVDKSLLQAEQGSGGLRYRMLETIARYATARLADFGAEAAQRATEAHALHFLALVEEAAPHLHSSDQVEWVAKLELDYDNVRVALLVLTTSADRGLEALRMVGALRIFWRDAGMGQGAHELAVAALARPEAQSASRERSAALLALASVSMDLGELMESRAFSEAGLAIAREIGDPVLTGFHLCGVATAFRWAGELDRAQEAAEGALAVADTAGNPNLLAWAHNLVATMPGIDDLDSARAHYASALRLFERAGNFSQIASTYVNLGNTEMIAGNLEVARLNFEAALEGPTTPYQRSVTLSNLGTVCLLEGDATAAEPHCREALRLSVRMGHWLDIRYPLLGLAVCASEFGDLERAALLHGAADSMVVAQGAPFDPAEAGLRDRDVSALRAKMGAAAFERCYARGQEMRRVDALDFAFA